MAAKKKPKTQAKKRQPKTVGGSDSPKREHRMIDAAAERAMVNSYGGPAKGVTR